MASNSPLGPRSMPPSTRLVLSQSEAHQLGPNLLTQADLADLFGISQRKLERDRHIGAGIPFVKVGRRVLYRREDILAFLEENRFVSTAEAKHAGGR
jgi:Helix-turn-helix domain